MPENANYKIVSDGWMELETATIKEILFTAERKRSYFC